MEGCDRPHKGHGFCHLHLQRWRKHGDPTAIGYRGYCGPPAGDPVDRIPKYLIRRGPDECWGWRGRSRTRDGYWMLIDYRTGKASSVYVHRLMYDLHVGPIPPGYEIDHLCFNPGCLNPAHLEAVTHAENTRRARTTRDPRTGRIVSTR